MTETERPRPTLRAIGAVPAGLVFIFIVTAIVDVVMHATGVFPPWGKPMSDALFGVATTYRIVISIAGCWITARLAPDRPMGHALALGAVGVVISAVGAAVTWNKGPGIWAALVPAAAHRHRDSVRVAWRQALRDAIGEVKRRTPRSLAASKRSIASTERLGNREEAFAVGSVSTDPRFQAAFGELHLPARRSIDILPRRHTLSGAAYAWRLAGLILGAEERGNQISDGLPPSGVNPARSW